MSIHEHLAGIFDSIVLALAVAAPFEQGEVLDLEYAEAMVLVIDEYICHHADVRRGVVEQT